MRVQDIPRRVLSFAGRIGVDTNDTDDVRLQKMLLTAFSMAAIVAGFLWGILYLAFDEPLAAAIPTSYGVLSIVSIGVFHYTRHLPSFRFIQLGFILLLPFLLMATLGGFVNASAVIVWSFLCPMGALVFCGPREAGRWFMAYLGLLIVSGVLQGWVRASNHLSPAVIIVFFVLNIGAISVMVVALLFYFITEKNKAFDLLRIEREKSETLLLNVLPAEIATILKNEPGIIAQHFDDASVLFADLVGFTPLSTQMTPVETVELLNEIFSHFDSLVARYHLEKIRTIGDNYMVAAGVPRPRPDHCQAIARLALDMRAYLRSLPPFGDQHIQFRIGLNCGPLVGGVIGHQKFHYDVWGDTVNTASRMESQGVPQEIQITPEAYERLKDHFACEPRGYIEVKGKGTMNVWLLTGEKDGAE